MDIPAIMKNFVDNQKNINGILIGKNEQLGQFVTARD